MIARTLLVVFFLALVVPAAPSDAAVKAGAKISLKRCAKCHGKTGKGDGAVVKRFKKLEKLGKLEKVNVPSDWTQREIMSKRTDEQLAKIIKEGVKGVGKSKPRMPAYGAKLSDAEIADLVAYIRSLAK